MMSLVDYYRSTSVTHMVATIAMMENGEERTLLYENLIEIAGVVEAQELLYRSGIPFDGASHLLNHTAGVSAYRTHGTSGIIFCKDYFLQSCYHGFLIEFIAEHGIEKIGDVITECASAGHHVVSQCSHGIGHGLLAWIGYKELPQAFGWCDSIALRHPDLVVEQCYNGVAMENHWAVHEGGDPSPDRWINDNDIFFPCTDPRIARDWRLACWQNQASVFFEHFKGDYKKTYNACKSVAEAPYRDACLNNLARQMHPGAEGSSAKARMLCNMMSEEDRGLCVARIATSEYSVGGRKMPFELCAEETGSSQNLCYTSLFYFMRALTPVSQDPHTYCESITDRAYRATCSSIVENDTQS